MKRIVLAFGLSLLTYLGYGQCNDLIISGVIDGPLTGGTPKAIEFYVVCNIPDLSIYGFGSANNGGGSDGQEYTFPAVAATQGDYIYVASEATNFTSFMGFAPDYTSGAAGINGDDAIELFCSGAVSDVFGDINTDGTGEPWDYLDGWAYRNSNTGPDGSTFTLGNWSFSGTNALDPLATNTGPDAFPTGTFTTTCGAGAPVVNFQGTTATVAEDGTSIDITVTSGALGAHTIDVVQTGGTAPGADYSFSTSTLSFAGSATASATITINDNVLQDCDRTVIFELQNAQGGAIIGGTATFTLTIEDDEVPPGTTLQPGDLVFTGFDNNLSGPTDRFVVTTLVDLAPGTSFTIANAVYESGAAANVRTDLWYACFSTADASISSQLITYDKCAAGNIPKGSILTFTSPGVGLIGNFQVNGVASSDFSVVDNGNGGGGVNFSTGDPDAIFLMQGEWTFNALDANFDGRVLGGIQDGATWYQFSDASVAGARISRVHPDIECLEIQGNTTPGAYAIAYDATQLHLGDQYDLLSEIKDFATNWTVYPTSTGDEILAADYSTPFTVNAASTAGLWRGDFNTNYFNCENWDNFTVPDEDDDVVIPLVPAKNMNIDTDATFSDRFNDTAICNSFTINGGEARIFDDGDILIVNGDLTIIGGTLQMDGATGVDGKLDVLGNWDNQVGTAAFVQGQSTVEFRGTGDQNVNLNGVGAEGFHHLIVDKASGEMILNQDLIVDEAASNSGVLTLVQGLINGNGNTLTVQNENVNSVVRDASTTPDDDSYLYGGNFTRYVGTGSLASYDFPVGGVANGSNRFQLAQVELEPTLVFPGVGPHTITTSFTSPVSGTIAFGANEGGLVFGELLDAGFWTIASSAAPTSGEYNANLFLRGSTNVTGTDFVGMKRASSAVDWNISGTPGTAPVVNGADVSIERNAFTTFSDFAIGKATATFPVEWLNFELLPEPQAVLLNWATAQEQNNDHFLVERSKDGQSFEIIGEVAGAGNSEEIQEYAFRDQDPLVGISHYRIRQVDLNGAYDWSETLTAVWNPSLHMEVIGIYPNPSAEFANLQLMMPQHGLVSLQVTNLAGQIVWQGQKEMQAGLQHVPLQVDQLANGVYLLQVSWLGQRKQISLMIQR